MGFALKLLSFAAPVLVAILLSLNYEKLPDEWPVHYGIASDASGFRMVADRTWSKSVLLVFSPVLTAMGVLLILYVSVPAMRIMNLDRQKVYSRLVSPVGLTTSLLFSLIGAQPLIGLAIPNTSVSWLLWLLLAVTVFLWFFGVMKLNSTPDSDSSETLGPRKEWRE